MPWAGIGTALALAGVSAASQQKKQEQERQQRAIDTRYSPWTHITPGTIDQNGALQGAIQGGSAGMALNQNNQNAQAWRDWMSRGNGPSQNTMPNAPAGSGWVNAPSQNLNSGIYGSNWGNQYAPPPGYGG